MYLDLRIAESEGGERVKEVSRLVWFDQIDLIILQFLLIARETLNWPIFSIVSFK